MLNFRYINDMVKKYIPTGELKILYGKLFTFPKNMEMYILKE